MVPTRDAARAVFLDRDGTIVEDVGYANDPRDIRLRPGAGQALSALKRAGFLIALISNQSGIGRRIFGYGDLKRVHAALEAQLRSFDVELDGYYYCPHRPEAGCDCRKPQPGLLLKAADDLACDLRNSFMVGDKDSDIAAGKRVGCQTILLRNSAQKASGATPDFLASDWPAIAKFILNGE